MIGSLLSIGGIFLAALLALCGWIYWYFQSPVMALQFLAAVLSLNLLWWHAMETDSYRRRLMLGTLGVLVVVAFAVAVGATAILAVFAPESGITGPLVRNR